MDDETGETSVKAETIHVAAHLRFMDQFFGFAGSSGESHVTFTKLELRHFKGLLMNTH